MHLRKDDIHALFTRILFYYDEYYWSLAAFGRISYAVVISLLGVVSRLLHELLFVR